MKKSIILLLLTSLGIGVTVFFTVDSLVTKKLSEISFPFNSTTQQNTGEEIAGLVGEEGTKKDESETKRDPKSKRKQRTFSEPLKVIKKFPFETGSVYKWIDRDGKIYILDPYTQQILELDYNGNLVMEYGAKGGAPWEHEGIMSFEVKNGELYTADNSKMVVKRGALGDKNLRYHSKIKETFWDAALLHNDNYIVFREEQNDNIGDFSFYVYNAAREEFLGKTSFRELLKLDNTIQYLNIAYGGHFVRNESGNLLYVCSRTGIFISFDESGQVAYVKETIDQNPPPKVSKKKSGIFTMYVQEPDLNSNYSSTLGNESLYVLSLIRFKKAKNLVVDQYSISNGEYMGSMEIPNDKDVLPREILITRDGKLWVVYENMNVVIYQTGNESV